MNFQGMNQGQLMEIILKQKDELKRMQAMNDILKVEARMDKETGVFNKGTGKDMIQVELDYAKESGKNLVITFIDFDNLKEVNNKYGHNEGDKYLTRILDIIKENVRGDDFIVRWGGDEFILVFLGTTIKKVRYPWDRVVAAISRLNGKSKYNIGISYGFAEYNSDLSEKITIDDLIHKADEEMYKCKNAKKEGI